MAAGSEGKHLRRVLAVVRAAAVARTLMEADAQRSVIVAPEVLEAV